MRRGAAAMLALLLLLPGCGSGENVQGEGEFPTFTFTHYASGGADSQETAVILMFKHCFARRRVLRELLLERRLSWSNWW